MIVSEFVVSWLNVVVSLPPGTCSVQVDVVVALSFSYVSFAVTT